MRKIDFKKEFGELYFPSAKEVVIVDVPPMNFAMVDGRGNPNDNPELQRALAVLYGVSFTLRFRLKKQGIAEYRVGPLEGLWWTDAEGGFSMDSKEGWKWTLMIMQPDVVTPEHFQDAVSQLKKKRHPPGLSKLRLERFAEGRSAQILYIGPYSAERPTIEKIRRYIQAKGYRPEGKHHEIYMGDPRRSAPEKLKTVIRQPMRS